MGALRIILTIVFIIVSVALAAIVLLQEGKSAGLGSLSGQSLDSYWNKNKGRSKEGLMVRGTTALVVLFFIIAAVLNIGSF